MHSLFRILLTSLLLIVSAGNLLAEGRLAWLPEYFHRVTSITDIVDGGYYLIAGTSQRDGHVMMSGEVVNKKLLGVTMPQEEQILCDNKLLVWQLHRTENDIIVRAAHSGKYLFAPQTNRPEVELHASQYTTWSLQEKEGGFVLKHPAESYRYLHTSYSTNTTNPNPFGNYFYTDGTIETNVLYFYKLDAQYEAPKDNAITYLQEGEKAPVYGNLLVQNGKLLYPSVLLDAQSFTPDQPFTIDEGQLTYSRTLQDENWETLALPFPASVPSGIEARELLEVSDGVLQFRVVTEVRPNVPVIFRRLSDATETVTFVSNAGTITPYSNSEGIFRGTYHPLSVSSASEGIFLLSASGKHFTLADHGSTLRPFRAYIKLNAETASRKLQMN